MKKRSILLIAMGVMSLSLLVGCGEKQTAPQPSATPAVEEQVVTPTESVSDNEGETPEKITEEIPEDGEIGEPPVQAVINFEKGLKITDGDFRLAIMEEDGIRYAIIDDGEFLGADVCNEEAATLEDGTEYLVVTVADKTVGYAINEDGSAVIIDSEGNVYDATVLKAEDVADMIQAIGQIAVEPVDEAAEPAEDGEIAPEAPELEEVVPVPSEAETESTENK